MSVLIVEDEPLVRMELVEDAARAGLEVLDAADASHALMLLSAHSDVSVVVTDINMPGDMNGIELACLVKAQRPAVTVIVTSAGRRPGPNVLPPGGRFVPKPYDPTRMIELMCIAARSAGELRQNPS